MIFQIPTKLPTTARNCTFAFLLSSSLLASGSAQSMEAVEFFEQLKTKAEANGNSLTYGELKDLGNGDVSATDIKVINEKQNSELSIGALLVTGGETDGKERFVFGSLEADAIKLQTDRPDDKFSLKIKSLVADDFSLDVDAEGKYPFWPFDISNGSAKSIQLIGKGKDNVSWSLPEIKIVKLESGQGNAFSMGDFRVDASTGSIATENGGNSSFALGEVRLQDLNVFDQVGFELGAIEMGRISLEGSDGKSRTINFNFDGMQGENLFSPNFFADINQLFPEEKMNATVGSASFSLDGQELFTFAGGYSRGNYMPDTKDYQSDFAMNDLFLDLKKIGEVNNQSRELKPFFDLGYETINLDLSGDVIINFENGILNVKQFRYSADDVAAMDMTMKLNGYTLDLAKKIQTISTKMGDGADADLTQALLLQMLAEFSTLSVEEMQITLDDASLTRRILDQQAKKAGQEAKDMVAAIPFMAGAVLSQLDAPEFAANVSTAIGTYMNSALNNSGSLIITAKPDEPISFVEIMGISAGIQAGNVKPAEIIERLNLEVSAK